MLFYLLRIYFLKTISWDQIKPQIERRSKVPPLHKENGKHPKNHLGTNSFLNIIFLKRRQEADVKVVHISSKDPGIKQQ